MVGKVNISPATYELVADFLLCEYCGRIPAKNKGELDVYFVQSLRPELRHNHQPHLPNGEFSHRYAALHPQPGPS